MSDRTCFMVLPFDGFDDIRELIEDAARPLGLTPIRADYRHKPGSVMQQVLHEISVAEVVVADISGHNPNVLYELALAHYLKGADRVVILAETRTREVFDIAQYRHLLYQNSSAGRRQLQALLPGALKEALESPTERVFRPVVQGRLQRTRLLVKDLRLCAARLREDSQAQKVLIRIVAGMSSLAISDRELAMCRDKEYTGALLEERDALRTAILAGARVQAVLNPPRRFTPSMNPERLRVRYERLLGLLSGTSDATDPDAAEADLAAIGSCEFVLTPVPMPNLFIIGRDVAYEGMKRSGAGGFEATVCETNSASVDAMIDGFDRLFHESRSEMMRVWPPDGRLVEQLRRFYAEASECA